VRKALGAAQFSSATPQAETRVSETHQENLSENWIWREVVFVNVI
jgi:hypothetical protein